MSHPIAEYFSSKFGLDVTDTVVFDEEKDNILTQMCGDSYSCALYNDDQSTQDAFHHLLVWKANANSKDGQGNPILSNVVQYADVHIVEALLQAGANVDAQDELGRTALSLAIKADQWQNVDLLLAHKADVSISDKDGVSCLYHAVGKGNVDLVVKLIGKGASAKTIDGKGETPAFHLVKNGKPTFGVVKHLIEAGLNLNVQNEEGNTVLHVAVMHEKPHHVYSILKCGASLGIKNSNGKTAENLNYCAEIQEIMEQHLERQEMIQIARNQQEILSLLKNQK